MTARPVDPDRTDAVAREPASIIGEFIDDAALMETGRSIGTIGSYRVAQALLTTDDPAAVAALLATLAERHPDQYLTAGRDAGVLTAPESDPELRAKRVMHVTFYAEAPDDEIDRMQDAVAAVCFDMDRGEWDPFIHSHGGDCQTDAHCCGPWTGANRRERNR